MLTVPEMKDYLHIDFDDDDALLYRLAKVAEGYISGAVGPAADMDDDRVKTIMLLVVSDLYDNRGIADTKTNGAIRRLMEDFMLQIKMEGRLKNG